MDVANDDFAIRQPSYVRAIFQPASLRGYRPKTKRLPLWLDYILYGPPVIRDSSPGSMAMVFGRTDHDTTWNRKPKGTLKRSFNGLALIAAYIFFFFVPIGLIYQQGIKPYHAPPPLPLAELSVKRRRR